MNYVKLHTDALYAYRRLSDTEFGRAVRAVLQYTEDGTEPNLPGKESIMFDVLREQVERDRKSYDKKASAQRENGSKGGRPRKNEKPKETHGFLENPTKPNETQKTQEKEKEKEYISPLTPIDGGGGDDEDDLLRLAGINNSVYDRAKECGFDVNTAVLDRLTELIAVHGADSVLSALEDCADHGAHTIAYLRKVLENQSVQAKTNPRRDYAADYL